VDRTSAWWAISTRASCGIVSPVYTILRPRRGDRAHPRADRAVSDSDRLAFLQPAVEGPARTPSASARFDAEAPGRGFSSRA